MNRAVAQIDALTRAFLARFFESEITSGTDDVKQFFFWLLAALAVPGMFIPWMMAFDWHMLSLTQGPEAVRIASRAEKTFYLGLSAVASGMLTTIAWGSIIPDKRDTLILGTLPVRPVVIVTAKLVALVAYVGLIALGMHAVGSVFWGLILGDYTEERALIFPVRGLIAHYLASSAVSAAVCFSVAAVQGVTLATAGPRLFARVSTLLQLTLVATIALFLAALPTITSTIVGTLAQGPRQQPWILSLPPVWFLGLYEWIVGTDDLVLHELARRSMLLLAGAVAVTAVTYPIAYRRLMVSVAEAGREERSSLVRLAHLFLVRIAGRHPAARAAAEFFTATVARVERQRFVIALALGLSVAWSLPGMRSYVASATPQPALLALPIAVMMFLLAGLRVASSLPGDVRAGWLFEAHDLSRRHARQALERMMFVLGILPPVLLSMPVYWFLWGAPVAMTHAAVTVAVGVAILEMLIWHCSGMPCGQQWVPARMGFGRRWPLHAAIFLIVTAAVPRLEVLLFESTTGTAMFVTSLLALAAALRFASARHQIIPIYEDVDPVAGVLRLG